MRDKGDKRIKEEFVTIIIPTYNSEITLPLVLESILNVDYDKKLIKVVIVDDASNDGTFTVAEDFSRKYSHIFHSIEVVRLQERVTTSKVRNEGVRRAIKYSYYLFLDSDVVLKTSTINELFNVLKYHREAGAAGALCITSNPSLFEKLMWFRYLGKVSEGPAGTGALMVKPEVFEKVGFFNEDLGYPKTIYEDLEYVMRIRKAGYNVLIDGRNPLLHLKYVDKHKTSKRRNFLPIITIAKHLASYFSPRKAYALRCVLKVAPLRYKVEYATYIILTLLLLTLLLTKVEFLFSILIAILFASSAWSLIVYRNKLNFILKVIGGPVVLLSRLLRSLSLIVYLLIAIFYRKTRS